jgi:rfaE bifunctional protein nucleotidyltransferase chain/domain
MINITNLDVYTSLKIIPIVKATQLVARFNKQNKKVGLCHGGFDLLHPGHVKHFESAKKICDVLIVSVTSDQFVSARKGDDRPIFTDKLRAYMIAHLDCVDYVVISDYKKGIEIIDLIKPAFYIKGPDFIGKETPGIVAERSAIAAIGGKMIYTHDPKLSTTEIIDYIQSIAPKRLLLILDRDGTIIRDEKFLGKDSDYEKHIYLNLDVINFIIYLQTKFQTTKIVVTNQSGVARGFFSENTVKKINSIIDVQLKLRNIKIDNWQYCPDMDRGFLKNSPGIRVIKKYLRETTKRKPSPEMVFDGLQILGKSISEFSDKLVLGDRDMEDGGLAVNLQAHYINVKGKNYDDLITLFQGFIDHRTTKSHSGL